MLTQNGRIKPLQIEHALPTLGLRTLVLHGRRLAAAGAGSGLILLEIQDVTERKAIEQRRQDSLALLAHELRNPVAAIIGYAQLLRRRLLSDEKGVASLDVIVDKACQVNRLVDDVLASADPGSEHLSLKPSRIDIVALARGSVQAARLLSLGYRICLEISGEPLEGFWDGGRLAQVFANLPGQYRQLHVASHTPRPTFTDGSVVGSGHLNRCHMCPMAGSQTWPTSTGSTPKRQAAEATDAIDPASLLHMQRHRRRCREARTLDAADRARARDPAEIGAHIAAMLEIGTVRHRGPHASGSSHHQRWPSSQRVSSQPSTVAQSKRSVVCRRPCPKY